MAIVVGDVHGNIEKVKAFLEYRPDQEHVALGDYLDSFTESVERQVECLQLLLDSKAILLWGNHDLHYLKTPPFVCTGYQHKHEQIYRDLIEANKNRFKAAHVSDGWLCTHAGVNDQLTKSENENAVADRLNEEMKESLARPHEPGPQSIFAIGGGRGGKGRSGGIFWFDFKREDGLDIVLKQIFGHTETPEPVINDHVVSLDATNNKNTVYLFDTQTEALVELPMPSKSRKRCKVCLMFVDYLNEDGTCTDCGKDTGLYWGFADSEQFVVVQAETAREAWEKAVKYWYEGQTITPTGVLPLNAREISHKRNYKIDNIIWQTGPGSNAYFFDDLHKMTGTVPVKIL